MPRSEGPYFYQNKKGTEFQSRNEKGQYSQIWIEESEFDRHSPEKYGRLLSEGPCEVVFRRVSSKAGGSRRLKCVKPDPLPRNAFDPRFPSLIAVIDLDEGGWKSFYYDQVKSIRRILPKELNYEQRKMALRFTGGDYDELFPGKEKEHLNEEDLLEKFEFPASGKYPSVLTNKLRRKEEETNEKKRVILDNMDKKIQERQIREQQRQQIIEKLQAADNNSTLQSGNEE